MPSAARSASQQIEKAHAAGAIKRPRRANRGGSRSERTTQHAALSLRPPRISCRWCRPTIAFLDLQVWMGHWARWQTIQSSPISWMRRSFVDLKAPGLKDADARHLMSAQPTLATGSLRLMKTSSTDATCSRNVSPHFEWSDLRSWRRNLRAEPRRQANCLCSPRSLGVGFAETRRSSWRSRG